MNSLRLGWLTVGCSLTLVACVEPTKPTAPTNPNGSAKPATEAKSNYKKPIRMNGRGEISSISLEKFFELQQSGKALIYDARPTVFHALGHIPGAISLPKHHCDENIAKREGEIKAALKKGKTIIVYCTSLTCPDARTVAIHISGFGYPVTVFSGGWDAWKEAGMPTE